ncbi:MAG TPA: PhzF family phenazine biosynthesis isomerase, partial [Xanthomonadales bacterium]|nr:PhzF family phenazine biosynthesis isomerase [Xanthomonadales bacterium]
NVGPTWLIVDLDDAEHVRRLKPDMTKLAEVNRDFGGVGVTVFGRSGDALTPIVVRSFCPGDAILEDPVCGSGNAAVAAFLREYGLVDGGEVRYVASQGREIGRDGLVHVRIDENGDIDIGGRAVTVIDGGIRL